MVSPILLRFNIPAMLKQWKFFNGSDSNFLNAPDSKVINKVSLQALFYFFCIIKAIFPYLW